MNPASLQAFRAHALAEHPKEACGLLVAVDGKEKYVACRNTAKTPHEQFALSADDYLAADLAGKILAVCHSHPNGAAVFSVADRSACEASALPWYVLSTPGCSLARVEPCGFKAPLLGREFVHGIHDCYGLVRDYYDQELAVTLPDFPRDDKWWEAGGNLYLENYMKAGFQVVSDLKQHDVILMQLRAKVVNHSAVYLGNGTIVQHVFGHLSHRTVYGGFWTKHTKMVVRHESQR